MVGGAVGSIQAEAFIQVVELLIEEDEILCYNEKKSLCQGIIIYQVLIVQKE